MNIYLVGNKIDDAEKREVQTEDGQARAEELKVHFMETSAKVGINVKQLFKNIAAGLPGVDGQESTAAEAGDNGFKLGEQGNSQPGQ